MSYPRQHLSSITCHRLESAAINVAIELCHFIDIQLICIFSDVHTRLQTVDHI